MLLTSKSVVLWINCVYFLVNSDFTLATCIEKEKCGDCIQTPGCAWCAEHNFVGKRCNDAKEMKLSPCRDIQDPQKGVPESKPRVNQTNSDTVTIKPGKYTVSGRVGDKVNVTMEFNDQPKKPLDLYYLLDSSCTMATVIKEVKESALILAENLGKLTSDLRLGLGGFVDKTVVPFIGDPNDVNVPKICHGGRNGIGPYGYRNYLRLSNSSMFAEAMKNHQTSYNYDEPEGQLDALMQAVVCDRVIDWREDRIRLIFLATDAEFHLAGDGKLGGIIKPHDGKCHMEMKTSTQHSVTVKTYQEYTHSTKLDYPSIAFLNTKIKEKGALVIFAVKGHVPLYEDLSKFIEGSAVVKLTETGNKIQKLIEDQFEKLTSTVEVGRFPESECFGGTYYALCPNQSDYVKGGKCSNRNNLKGPRNITFQIEIEFKKCDPRRCSNQIEIPIIGLTQKKLQIELNPICECDCENSVTTSGACENGGTFNCGICECQRNYCGAKCEAKTDEDPNRRKCLQDGMECSGRGTCNCGRCNCNSDYQGPYCEYDKRKCPHNNEIICSGFGDCNATTNSEKIQSFKCDCRQGYKGPTCDCSPHQENCRGISTQELCSNKGDCECNNCKCSDGYCGPLCQHCFFNDQETPSTITSTVFKKCLQCYLNDLSASTKEPKSNTAECLQYCKDANLTKITVEKEIGCGKSFASETEGLGSVNLMNKIGCESSAVSCGSGEVKDDGTQCTHNFTYECSPSDKNMLTIKLNSIAQECPKPVNLFLIVVSVGGLILLLGILTLLIWRLATYMYDKREYEKFKTETDNAQFSRNENPMYKPVMGTFTNPSYNTMTS